MKKELYICTIRVKTKNGEEVLSYDSKEFTENDRAELMDFILNSNKTENND